MLTLKAPLLRETAKQIDRIECANGRYLKVMQARIPGPGFGVTSCGPKPVTEVDPEFVTGMMWAACAESPQWVAILDDVLDHMVAADDWEYVYFDDDGGDL